MSVPDFVMRTLKLTIAYDGTRYAGWQAQRRAHGPTIQGALEKALSWILRERVSVVGSGRTDAGVHAEGQVAHVRTRSRLSPDRILRSLNALLPSDIAVLSVEEAPESFHARFHAVSKHYRYRIFTGPVVPPFIRPYVHHVRIPLHLRRMQREATPLKGAHDFRAFARAGSLRRGAVRRISDIRVRRVGEEIRIDVEGTGFLHTMVRSIAGTLIDVGRGHRPAGTITRMLARRARHLCGGVAPAQGLSLVRVRYPRAKSGTRSQRP